MAEVYEMFTFLPDSSQQAIQMHKLTEQQQDRLKQGCYRISWVKGYEDIWKGIWIKRLSARNKSFTNSGIDKFLFPKEMEKATKHTHTRKLCWFILTPSCSCLKSQASCGHSTCIVQCITTAQKENIFKISGTIINTRFIK